MKRLGGGIWGAEGCFVAVVGFMCVHVCVCVGGPFDVFRAAKKEGALPELANTFSW